MITCCSVFKLWPKITVLLPVGPQGAKRLATPESVYIILLREPEQTNAVQFLKPRKVKQKDVSKAHQIIHSHGTLSPANKAEHSCYEHHFSDGKEPVRHMNGSIRSQCHQGQGRRSDDRQEQRL